VILAMTKPKEEQEFRLGWSLWRRAHHAVAKRCHQVSHAAKHGPLPEEERLPDLAPPAPATTSFSTPIVASCLTDEKWKLVKPLMPPQKPPTGLPRSAITARWWPGCCRSSETVLGGGIYRKRSSGRGARSMVTTADGARKASGSG
jgi:hypothetical protein